MPEVNAKPIGLVEALDQGEGFAHVAHWNRGTYLYIRRTGVWIHLESGKDKPYNLTWNTVSEIKYHPGKGLPKCESCKDADEIYRTIDGQLLYEHIVTIAAKMIKHLKSPEHCTCKGGR